MKAFFFVALIAISQAGFITQSKNSDIEDFRFMNKVLYSIYDGFISGMYREQNTHVVSDECFGEWIT